MRTLRLLVLLPLIAGCGVDCVGRVAQAPQASQVGHVAHVRHVCDPPEETR